MSLGTDFKLIKQKKLDRETLMTVSQNIMSGRIYVQYTSENPRIVLQRNFQDNYEGLREVERFAESIRTTVELKKYFGLSAKEKK